MEPPPPSRPRLSPMSAASATVSVSGIIARSGLRLGGRSGAGDDRQPRRSGVAEIVVDCDDAPAGGGEDGRGDGGPIAGAAVHPHLAVKYFVQATEQAVQRDVDGAVDVGLAPFQV